MYNCDNEILPTDIEPMCDYVLSVNYLFAGVLLADIKYIKPD